MKKIILFIMISIISVFVLASCGDEPEEMTVAADFNGSEETPIDSESIKIADVSTPEGGIEIGGNYDEDNTNEPVVITTAPKDGDKQDSNKSKKSADDKPSNNTTSNEKQSEKETTKENTTTKAEGRANTEGGYGGLFVPDFK